MAQNKGINQFRYFLAFSSLFISVFLCVLGGYPLIPPELLVGEGTALPKAPQPGCPAGGPALVGLPPVNSR